MTKPKTEQTFPGKRWETARPSDVGMDPEKVGQVEGWFDDALGEGKGRLVIVRRGRVVLESYHNIDAAEKLTIASAAKSAYSNVLGILVDEEMREMQKIVDALITEGVSFGSILVARHWTAGKRAVFPYLLSQNIAALKKRLRHLGFDLLDPADWQIDHSEKPE